MNNDLLQENFNNSLEIESPLIPTNPLETTDITNNSGSFSPPTLDSPIENTFTENQSLIEMGDLVNPDSFTSTSDILTGRASPQEPLLKVAEDLAVQDFKIAERDYDALIARFDANKDTLVEIPEEDLNYTSQNGASASSNLLDKEEIESNSEEVEIEEEVNNNSSALKSSEDSGEENDNEEDDEDKKINNRSSNNDRDREQGGDGDGDKDNDKDGDGDGDREIEDKDRDGDKDNDKDDEKEGKGDRDGDGDGDGDKDGGGDGNGNGGGLFPPFVGDAINLFTDNIFNPLQKLAQESFDKVSEFVTNQLGLNPEQIFAFASFLSRDIDELTGSNLSEFVDSVAIPLKNFADQSPEQFVNFFKEEVGVDPEDLQEFQDTDTNQFLLAAVDINVSPGDRLIINNYLSTAVNIPLTNIYVKVGNFNTALEDLKNFFAGPLRPIEERVPGRLFIVRLDEQVTVVARNFSSDGRPTIEIQDKSSGTSVALAKVRYELIPPTNLFST